MGKGFLHLRVVAKENGRPETEVGRPELMTLGSQHSCYLGAHVLRVLLPENPELRSAFHKRQPGRSLGSQTEGMYLTDEFYHDHYLILRIILTGICSVFTMRRAPRTIILVIT